MSLIDQLFGYVDRYDPGFRDRVVGAREDEISELQRLVPAKLPADYVEFLERMGRNDGGLRLGADSSTDIDELLAYYRDIEETGEVELLPPPGFIVIAYIGVGTFELSLRVDIHPGPRVFYTSGPDIKGVHADTLEAALFRAAFVRFRMPSFPVSGIYWGERQDDGIDRWTDAIAQLGYRKEPFSDSVAFCGDAGNRALIGQSILGRSPWFRIAGKDQSTIEADASVLSQAVHLEFRQWWP